MSQKNIINKDQTKQHSLRTAVQEAIGRIIPTELRGNDEFTTHLPAELVGQRGPMKVLRFEPQGTVEKEPILFVYSLINRYYILDFMPNRSLIEYFTEQGRPCYVIDWGFPGVADRYKTWGDYALRYIDFAAKIMCWREEKGHGLVTSERTWDQVIRRSPRAVHIYAYCVGGSLALTYAALRPERVKSLTLMATPIDFHDESLLSRWTDPERFDVDRIVDAYGHVPTWLLEGGFRMLAPLSNLTKWRDLWQGRQRENFINIWRRMEQWASDNVPFPAEVYRQYIRDTYQSNAFFNGEMLVDGEQLKLENITCPTLLLIALRDQIVPPKSALAIQEKLETEQLSIVECDTGHLGLSTSGKARTLFWPKVEEWLSMVKNESTPHSNSHTECVDVKRL
jgi:polyhydroxyalkanoate synthase subunit PhaC